MTIGIVSQGRSEVFPIAKCYSLARLDSNYLPHNRYKLLFNIELA